MAQNQSQYKLVYFDFRGLGEAIRYIFAYVGVDFEDERIPFKPEDGIPSKQKEWLAKKKADTPFHQIPVLEVDGKMICHSNTIARFLGRRFNLAGKDEFEQQLVDALADYVTDMIKPLILGFIYEEDDSRKKQCFGKYFGETVHEYLRTFEENLKKNGDGKGFFVGGGPTWVDFVIATNVGMLQAMNSGLLDSYPLLRDHENRVRNLKGIKEWIAKSPQSLF